MPFMNVISAQYFTLYVDSVHFDDSWVLSLNKMNI